MARVDRERSAVELVPPRLKSSNGSATSQIGTRRSRSSLPRALRIQIVPFPAEAEGACASPVSARSTRSCLLSCRLRRHLAFPPGPRGQGRPGAVRDAGERVLLGSVLRVAGRGSWALAASTGRTGRGSLLYYSRRFASTRSNGCLLAVVVVAGRPGAGRAQKRTVPPAPRHVHEVGVCTITARREGFVALSQKRIAARAFGARAQSSDGASACRRAPTRAKSQILF